MDVFDEWVLQDNNLDYLLPEKRGIIALRPRRREKQYSYESNNEFWQENEKNKKRTYFLIRDGENVYRIFTRKLLVLNRLFPKRNELAEMFEKFEAARSESAKETFEDDMYQYRKRATFLQGLLDRTAVFGLHEPINLFNLNDVTEKQVRFVYDDDDNLIGDGRMKFSDWKKTVNEQIVEGSRILITGDFGGGYSRNVDFKDRLFYYVNDHNAPGLPQKGIYIVETLPRKRYQKEPYDALIIRHNPEDEIGTSGWTWDPHIRKNRVAFEIYRRDDFVLAYDFINPEDVTYYLYNRQHRHEYSDMLPILEAILDLKAEEADREQPFVQLIMDEAIRRKIATSEEEVRKAIVWWKTKNKWKRSLEVDEPKALRMIIKHLSGR